MSNLKLNNMKTKVFLLVCFFAGIGLTQLMAQNSNAEATKSVQGWFQSTYWSPVYCGDEMIDYLEGGVIIVHYVVHYKVDEPYREIDQIRGKVTSRSGEVFSISEIDKTYKTDHWYLTWHYVLSGNQGTKYVGTLTYSYWTGETTVGMTTCL
jgi:hypothetical protein